MLFLLLLPQTSAELDGTFAFTEMGSVAHTVSNAHLVIPIDFQAVNDKLESFCLQMEKYIELMMKRPDPFSFNYPDHRVAELALQQCYGHISEFKLVKEIWCPQPFTPKRSSPSPSRRKRGGGWAVIGIGSEMVTFKVSTLRCLER